jgi:hypothetical protein
VRRGARLHAEDEAQAAEREQFPKLGRGSAHAGPLAPPPSVELQPRELVDRARIGREGARVVDVVARAVLGHLRIRRRPAAKLIGRSATAGIPPAADEFSEAARSYPRMADLKGVT